MYLKFKNHDGTAEILISEDSFILKNELNINAIIDLFKSMDGFEFSVFPNTYHEARALMGIYCACDKSKIPDCLVEYIQSSLNNYLKGKTIQEALNIELPPHRLKSKKNIIRDLDIFEFVQNKMKKGQTLFDSALDASEKFGLHESNIQKIYSSIKKRSLVIDKNSTPDIDF